MTYENELPTGIPELCDLSSRKDFHVITQPLLLLNPLRVTVFLGGCRLDCDEVGARHKCTWSIELWIRVTQCPCALWKVGSKFRLGYRVHSGLVVVESPDVVWLDLKRGWLSFAQAAKERIPQKI